MENRKIRCICILKGRCEMNKRMLGNGLEVSDIGFGCMGLTYAYEQQPENNTNKK